MPSRNIITGIDVGSTCVRVVIAEADSALHPPQILGTGIAESRGMRRGYIVNEEAAAKSIRQAVGRAEKAAGTKIETAFLSAGGVGLEGTVSVGSALVSGADKEVDRSDVERATLSAERFLRDHRNKKILQSIPLSFRLDGKEVLGRPGGMRGTKLEVKSLVIASLSQHIDDLISAADTAGIEVLDVLPSPCVASAVALSKLERTAGCVLCDIGSETTTVAVFENNLPVSLQVFPTGSADITNDIALKKQITLEEAERVKYRRLDGAEKKEYEAIITSRLEEMFNLVETHLKGIDRNGLLPAGIVLIGAGSNIKSIAEVARQSLQLPSKVAEVHYRESKVRGEGGEKEKTLRDGPAWAIAYGLSVLGNQEDEEEGLFASSGEMWSSLKKKIGGFFRQFLP